MQSGMCRRICSMRGLSPRPMAHRTIALTTELMEPCCRGPERIPKLHTEPSVACLMLLCMQRAWTSTSTNNTSNNNNNHNHNPTTATTTPRPRRQRQQTTAAAATTTTPTTNNEQQTTQPQTTKPTATNNKQGKKTETSNRCTVGFCEA